MQTFIKRIFISIVICNSLLYAFSQTTNNSLYITTIENAILYNVPKNITRYQHTESRELIIPSKNDIKRFKKPISAEIIGLKNSKAQLHYDMYEVEYKDKRYYVPMEYVISNVYIDSINLILDYKLDSLLNKSDSLTLVMKATIGDYKQLYKKKIHDLEIETKKLPLLIDSIERNAVIDYETEKKHKFEIEYNSWYKKQPTSTKNAIKAIRISEASLSSPNSAGGCDYRLYYTNKSKKTIKYLYWDGWVYNAVNDIVSCEIRGSGFVRGKDTGPIEPEEDGGGLWECVIYNYSAEEVRLSSIDIQYMDNSRITITREDIRRILKAPEMPYISYHQTDSVKKRASKSYKNRQKECNDSLRIYKNKLHIIEKEIFDTEDFLHLKQLKQEIDDTYIKIEKFKKNNFLNNIYNTTIIKDKNKEAEIYEQNKQLNKKVTFGTGAELLFSGSYFGTTIPLEVVFGRINNFINFSISGEYTFLSGHKILRLNKLCTYATLHFNFGKEDFRYPLSVGLGYNHNFNRKNYDITGYYYTDDYQTQNFSFPILVNKNNFASIISWGIRTRHWKVAMYARFDITPTLNKSFKDSILPKDEYIFYDNTSISNLLEAPKSMLVFGIMTRYYF